MSGRNWLDKDDLLLNFLFLWGGRVYLPVTFTQCSQSYLSSFQDLLCQSSAPTDADNCKTSFVTKAAQKVIRKAVIKTS